MSILPKAIDERFWTHRRQSTSAAGIACAVLALLLFMYRHYVQGRWNWDLLVVACAFIAVKYALMAWYYMTD